MYRNNPSRFDPQRHKEGVERLLLATVIAGRAAGVLSEGSFDQIIVDTTVQPKARQSKDRDQGLRFQPPPRAL